jgi:hypothetical protein
MALVQGDPNGQQSGCGELEDVCNVGKTKHVSVGCGVGHDECDGRW